VVSSGERSTNAEEICNNFIVRNDIRRSTFLTFPDKKQTLLDPIKIDVREGKEGDRERLEGRGGKRLRDRAPTFLSRFTSMRTNNLQLQRLPMLDTQVMWLGSCEQIYVVTSELYCLSGVSIQSDIKMLVDQLSTIWGRGE
jgi:hypothetical protein